MGGLTPPWPAGGPARVTKQVDAVCDRFESAWRSGSAPRVEDYVAEADDADRQALLSELVALERELRRRRGEHPKIDEYLERFPRYVEVVRLAFDEPLAASVGDDGPRPSASFDGPPLELGDFELRGVIGRGGMGVVYRAYDRRRGQVVALKTIQWVGPLTLYRFKQEFRTLADISHPNLVTLYELASFQGNWYFTMEFVDGTDFLAHVRSRVDLPDADTDVDSSLIGARPAPAETTEPCTADNRAPHRAKAADSGSDGQIRQGNRLSFYQFGRLRRAMRQLAEGLAALHAADKLHRDIKPSNVLVTPEGRVVIVDFGLAVELGPSGQHHSTEPHVLGTSAYMAPEQAAELAVSPASDWYSVGVILYEALTGRLPFLGRSLEVLMDKQRFEPPSPFELVPDLPDDLGTLCVDLLRRHPETRPSGRDVLRRLGSVSNAQKAPASQSSPQRSVPLVGRERHLEAMEAALAGVSRGRTIILYVHGCSGAGKTALVQHFLTRVVEQGDAVVLAGRCYEHESVPYKAVDSLIDALSRYLKRLPLAELQALLPREIHSLARVFPVLRQIEAVAVVPRRSLDEPGPRELRRRAFAALRELLARLGDRAPLVLFVDDLQWGDVDSAALIAEILRPPDPPVMLLVGAYRAEDASSSPFLRELLVFQEGPGAELARRDVAVDSLAQSEAESLATTLLGAAEAESPGSAAAIAVESGGNPFFVAELVRHVQAGVGAADRSPSGEEITLDGVLWERILRLPDEARRLLEIIAISGRPLGHAEACQAAAVDADARGALAILRSGRLIRGTGPTDRDEVETYHDRVRETVVAHIAPDKLASHHRRLAQALQLAGDADPEVLATHYDAAGELGKAGEYYAMAAAQASKSLAFDRAVKLYRRALVLRPVGSVGDCQLRTGLGDALANAGRGAEAAAEYLAAAEVSASSEAPDLRCKAVTQLLTSGNIDEGLAVLNVALRSVGMRLPSTQLWALVSLLLRRLRVRLRGLRFRHRPPGVIKPADLRRIDICWSAATGLGVVDLIRGFDFHSLHFLLSLRAGEPRRIAVALGWEAAHSAIAGVSHRSRTAQIFGASERLSVTLKDNYVNAFLMMAKGCAAYLEGLWTAAESSLRDAENLFESSCTGVTWELDTTRTFSLWSLICLGSVADLSRRLTTLRREAEERGDLYFLMNLSSYIMAIATAANDEPEAGREALSRASRRWSQRGFHVQHHNMLLATVILDLYEGDGHAAWKSISERWSAYRKSLLLHTQQVRIDVVQLWARSSLAIATRSSDSKVLLAETDRKARRLERERAPWATAHALAIRAGIARIRGDRSEALALLTDATKQYEGADMHLFAATARRRLGELLGGDEGQAHVAKANDWMASQGVRKPGRITAMYMPGFPNTD
jgi:eukaryotic-like serine/threonine-protein kinase